MKTITFVADAAPEFKTPILFKVAVERYISREQGIVLSEQRRRLRVMKAIDKAADAESFTLEDADYDVLKRCYDGFAFGIAHEDIVRAGDAIDAAVTPGPEEK